MRWTCVIKKLKQDANSVISWQIFQVKNKKSKRNTILIYSGKDLFV